MNKHVKVSMICLMAGLSGVAFSQTTWDVGPAGDFPSIEAAIADASVVDGDVLQVEAGTYQHSGTTLTIGKELTIIGAGMGQTIITHTGALSTDTVTVDVNAPNVTLRDLSVNYGNGDAGNIYRGVALSTDQANTTLENVEFNSDIARRVLFINNGSSDTRIIGCVFRGRMNREAIDVNNNTTASPGTLLIRDCVFEQAHYQQGPIRLQGSSGQDIDIRYNYFVNRVGVTHATDGGFPTDNYGFQSDGSMLYTISVNPMDPGRTVNISHNTFVFQDGNRLNRGGNVPLMRAIDAGSDTDFEPGQLVIADNIFQGFKADPGTFAVGYSWQANGIFGGALELDGANGFGQFEGTSDLMVGETGTFTAWVKLDNTGKRNQLLEGPGDGNLEFQYRPNTGGQYFVRPYDGDEYAIQAGGAASFDWTLVQFTWDRSVSEARIYTGDQASTSTEVSYLSGFDPAITGWNTPADTTAGTFFLGRDPGLNDRFLDGMLDDVAIFDAPLSPAELETIRTSGVAAFAGDSRLAAHWSFDEGTGTTAADSASGLDITLSDIRTALQAYAVYSNATAEVNNNLYFDNSDGFLLAATDANQILGDPQFLGTGTTPAQFYGLPVTSPGYLAATDGFNIGASQFDVPAQLTAGTLEVVRRRSATITPSVLQAIDPAQNASALTFTVTAAPTQGAIELAGTPAASFTQQDINDGIVVYVHDAGSVDDDSFDVELSDTFGPVDSATVTINVLYPEDADRDGLALLEEDLNNDGIRQPNETDPALYDTDGDGLGDGMEVSLGTDPLDINDPAPGGNPPDADNDGIPDAFDANPNDPDANGDGILDGYALQETGDPNGAVSLGDAQQNGGVDNADAINVLGIFLGIENDPTHIDMDVNMDGRVDNVDAVLIFNFFLGNIPYIPFPGLP